MSHTPGPWRVNNQLIMSGPEDVVADCSLSGNEEADAHLIAAAPEMLELLLIFKEYEGCRDNEGLRQLSLARHNLKKLLKTIRGES